MYYKIFLIFLKGCINPFYYKAPKFLKSMWDIFNKWIILFWLLHNYIYVNFCFCLYKYKNQINSIFYYMCFIMKDLINDFLCLVELNTSYFQLCMKVLFRCFLCFHVILTFFLSPNILTSISELLLFFFAFPRLLSVLVSHQFLFYPPHMLLLDLHVSSCRQLHSHLFIPWDLLQLGSTKETPIT